MKKIVIALAFVVLVAVGGAIYTMAKSNSNAPVVHNQKTYIALGDSVAAGVGIGDYVDSSACNRTTQSYPERLAGSQNLKLIGFACSGATIKNGVVGSQTVNGLSLSPQLNSLFKQPTPSLITITIGANDARWTEVLRKCYTGDCGSAQDVAAVKTDLKQVSASIRDVLRQINSHYVATKPRVLVTGYYQVFPNTVPANCSDLSGINGNELAFGRGLQSDLSAAIAAGVNGQAGATYVPISFAGHELCTADSWVQSLTDKQPYHPNKAGQAAIALQLARALSN